jgi:large subunit ribosomal protein L3
MATKSRVGRKAILGKKIAMTQVFDEAGYWVPVTVLQAGPCTVLQVKTAERDGYSAVQLGFDDTRKARKWPQQAFYERLGVSPKRLVGEVPFVDPADLEAGNTATRDTATEEAATQGAVGTAASGSGAPVSGETSSREAGAEAGGAVGSGSVGSGGGEGGTGTGAAGEKSGEGAAKIVGSRLRVTAFKDIPLVDVRGVTKGRGFSGVIRRYRFQAGDKAHGSKNVREPGSTGMHTDPGRVLKGKRMPGHQGAVRRKARNLLVVGIEPEDNLLLVRGSVPGRNGGYVYIEESLVRPKPKPAEVEGDKKAKKKK